MSDISVEQKLAVVADTKKTALEREQAIHSLKNSPTPEVIEELINGLDDDQEGVRWAASSVLIEFGEAALKPLLQALIDRHDSVWLRRGAYRVFHDTKSLKVQQATGEVVKALTGPAAESTTTDAAARAMLKLLGM
jgi:HEAT repeat protein